MMVLVACEESQAVCKAFRERGHEAYSCDLIDCSGGHPEWHIKENCLPIIGGGCTFTTCDGELHKIDGLWDLVIAHPPCTYLTTTANRWFKECYGVSSKTRYINRLEAINFFMQFVYCSAKRVAIENPLGIMSGVYRKPDQIIQPYEYGHPARKMTCLWLKNLPLLTPTEIVVPDVKHYQSKNTGKKYSMSADYGSGNPGHGARRSKTYPGIAKAMAEQWG